MRSGDDFNTAGYFDLSSKKVVNYSFAYAEFKGTLWFDPVSKLAYAEKFMGKDASGKALWRKEKVGKYHAAMLRTGDDKLLMLDDFGNLSLIQPDAKEYRELCRTKVCGETWSHPAIANGRLYVRDKQEVRCLEFAK